MIITPPKFKKTAKQVELTRLQSLFMHTMAYGGSRSGKTFGTLRNIYVRAAKVKSRHVILRHRFSHVKASVWYDTMPKVERICFPNLPVKENKSDWFKILPNGSEIWIAGLDDAARVEKILGNEYSTLYFNECSQIGWSEVEIAHTRLSENAGLKNRAFYDCNPPSKKHWTYKLFVEHIHPVSGEKVDPSLYGIIQMNPRDNEENLAEGYIDNILSNLSRKQRKRFRDGEFGLDTEGALWDRMMIDRANSAIIPTDFYKVRTVVAIDPSITSDPEDSDECGIVAASEYDHPAIKTKYTVDADWSGVMSPDEWADMAIALYRLLDADAIVIEKNQGGDMVDTILRNKGFRGRIIPVWAKVAKILRAEPVSALYEQDLVGHAQGLEPLEDEMQEYVPKTAKRSPNRLDAGVYALKELSDPYKGHVGAV